MALQIDVRTVDAIPDGDGGTLTLNLKCWAEGDNPATDTPVIDVDKSAFVLRGVEGQTDQQLINRATLNIGLQFQAAINAYKRRELVLGMVNVTAVENGLVG